MSASTPSQLVHGALRARAPPSSLDPESLLAALNQAPVEALRTVFLDICLPDRWRRRTKQEGCGTGKEHSGSCSMWMARDKLLVNAPCLVRLIFHRHTAAWTRSVLQAISDASGERRSEPGPQCFRLIRDLRIGTFSGASGVGNGDYRGELRQATKTIGAYVKS